MMKTTTSEISPQQVFEVITPGLRASLQDEGRAFLKKWGVPRSGVMDQRIYRRLCMLLDLADGSAVVESMLGGLELRCLNECWISHAGPGVVKINGCESPSWRTVRLAKHDRLTIAHHAQGLWNYLAVESGFVGEQWLGSRSVWPAGGMGALLKAGDILERYTGKIFPPHSAIKARYLDIVPHSAEPIAVWPGPQWEDFPEASRCQFLQSTWKISPQSSRAGYRLDGPQLDVPAGQMLSEPMLLGSIQVPPNGQPIAILNDGPTVGGYPKIALIAEESLDQFRQSSPGTPIQFSLLK
jgi:biotin-dependent carboxylase-like uncharacterized protein